MCKRTQVIIVASISSMTLALETFKWEGTQLETRYCFELKIPSYLRKEGVSKIKLQANFYKVYFYSNGWFNSESPEVNYEETRKLVVVHDVVHLLDYDSKPCIEDSNYSNNICKRDFIYKVGHYILFSSHILWLMSY